jgi:acyl dehydratase
VRIEDLEPGLELGPSGWFDVPQERIDAFADVTEDRQWIHVDPELAAQSPFGTTVAHGLLTLGLVIPMTYELMPVEDARLAVNYGLNRVRFPAPVPAGSRVRGRLRIIEVTEVDGAVQVVAAATVEREGTEKPVVAAELVFRLYR